MLRRTRLVCTLAMLFVAPGLAASAAQPVGGNRAITGTVVDARSSAGIAGAHVHLAGSAGGLTDLDRQRIERDTVSDGEGRFRFDAIPAGRYRLTIALDGFAPFDDPRELLVTDTADPPPLLVAYVLRVVADVQATAIATVPVDAAAGSEMNVIPGHAVAVSPGGLEDVMRVFQRRPGVAASQDDRNDLLVRGGGAIENATRVDGFDVSNPSHFGSQGGSGGGFSFIAPWLIDHAVLRAGGFSVQYGERASSVLDLALRPGSTDRLRGQVGASIGGAMAEAEGPIGARGSWLASARRSFLDVVLSRGVNTAVPHYSDFIGRAEYAVSARQRVELLGIGAVDNVAVNSSAGGDDIRDNQTSALVGLSLNSQWSGSTTSAVYVSYGRTRMDAVMNDGSTVDALDRSTEIELRARGEISRRFGGDGQVSGGLAVKRADLRFDLEAAGLRTQYNYFIPPLHSHFPYAFSNVAGYAELRTPSVHGLQMTGGVRVDRIGTTDRFYTSPRVNLEYRATKTIRLTGAWGVYRQEIPYIWIGSNPANALLSPVRSLQTIAGVTVRLPSRTDLLVEGFDKRYDGYPIDPSEPWHVLVDAAADFESPFVGHLLGSGKLRARGVDSSLVHTFGRRLSVELAYSLWRVTQAGADGVWRRSDYDIRNQARASIAYDVAGKWRAAAEYRYADGRAFTPYDPRISLRAGSGRYDQAQLNAATYPPYTRVDVRLDRTFAIRGTLLVAYAEVDNIYDRNNVLAYEWNKTARQPRPVYQWGRLPIAGIRWMF